MKEHVSEAGAAGPSSDGLGTPFARDANQPVSRTPATVQRTKSLARKFDAVVAYEGHASKLGPVNFLELNSDLKLEEWANPATNGHTELPSAELHKLVTSPSSSAGPVETSTDDGDNMPLRKRRAMGKDSLLSALAQPPKITDLRPVLERLRCP